MKKILSLIIVMVMLMNVAVFADTTAVPVLISAKLFDVTYDGDVFTITLEENASTGYEWVYTINDESLVKYISDEYIQANTDLLGAPGQHQFVFESLGQGLSTISFEKKRAFEDEDEAVAAFDMLVYKTEDTLIVEEDYVATIVDGEDLIMDGKSPVYTPQTITINDLVLDLDVNIQVIDGVTMVPVAETLRALGYEVKWHAEDKQVEISKGAQWTTITIGENAYFKNRMAPSPLSSAPVIVDNRTLVPAEFFSAILDLGITIDSGQLEINEDFNGFYSGYVKEIAYDETGMMRLSLVADLDQEMMDVLIYASNAFTYTQVEIEEGQFISVIASPVSTMSMPPHSSAIVIY